MKIHIASYAETSQTDQYEANTDGYNASISCVLSLCHVLT